MEKKDPIEEARRYVDNAKSLLINNGELDEETHLYGDRKYVKMAGNTLWCGVLYLLDAVFHVRKDRRTRVHIEDDGNPSKGVCDSGFRMANDIIDRCARLI